MGDFFALLSGLAGLLIVGLLFALNQARSGRARLEAELAQERAGRQASETQLRFQQRAMDAVGQAVIAADAQGNLVIWNRAAEQLFGWRAEDVLGQSGFNILHEETSQEEALAMWNRIQSGEVWTGETAGLRKDGVRFPATVTISAIRAEDGAVQGVISICDDISQKVQSRQALEQSEQRYRELFQSNPMPMWVFEQENLLFLDVNESALTKYGYSREQFLQMTVRDIRPAGDASDLIALLSEAEAGVLQWEGQHRLADGRQIHVAVTSHPVENQGRPARLVMAQDITAAKEALHALMKSEEKYRKLLETSQGLVWSIDAQGRITYINQASRYIYGREPEEMIGRLYTDFIPPEQAEANVSSWAMAIDNNDRIVDYENWVLHKDGRPLLLNANAMLLRDAEGNVIGSTGTSVDITARKEAELRRQRLVERLTILRAIDQEILRANSLSAIYTTVLGQMQRLIPCSHMEIGLFDEVHSELAVVARAEAEGIDLAIRERYPITDRASFAQFQSGRPLLTRPGAHPRPLLSPLTDRPLAPEIQATLAVPLSAEEGLIGALHYFSETPDFFTDEHREIALDIANQLSVAIRQHRLHQAIEAHSAELEQRVAERTALLQAKTQELETFTYSVSHDLKAPLRGIDGYSRLLLEDYLDKLDDEGRGFLHAIRTATTRMGQLIEDLLAYSRLERRAFQWAELDPRRLVDVVLEERAEEIAQRGVQVTVDIDCPTVAVDADGLAMALRNLVGNALKFTKEKADPQIAIGGKMEGDWCILWVRDNGIGFDMKFHDRIFDIFQRLQRSEDYPGTGVGLALVRKSMERLGGRAWAESTPNGGATFYLQIPKKLETSPLSMYTDLKIERG